MHRKNAIRLLLASGVLGGFIVGWTLSTWVSRPATSEEAAVADAVTHADADAVAHADAHTDAHTDTDTDTDTHTDTHTDADAHADAHADTVAHADARTVALADAPAPFAAAPSTRHAPDPLPAFSEDTALRRRIAGGRVNRGIRRLFGLGPAPRRSGGRAVRHVILETPVELATRRATTGTATASDVRFVASAARVESPGAPRAFGTTPTLTTGLIDAFGTRTSGLAMFEGPPKISPPPPLGTVGACCLAGASADCVETLFRECESAGGVFLGADVMCDQRVVRNIFVGTTGALRLETLPIASCPRATETLTATIAGVPDVRIDAFRTADDAACASYWSAASCVIPAHFFGPGSRAFKDRVCLRGAPLGGVVVPGLPGVLDFEDADTLIRRSDDPFDECHAPSPDPVTVDIAVERMLLDGAEPLVVTYDGSDHTEIWNVRVEVADGGGQPEGFLTAYKEHPNGGRFDATLVVCPTLVFTRFGDPRDVRVLDYCTDCDPEGIVFATNGVPWAGTTGAALALPNPVPTAFHPGVRNTSVALDADCNENGFLDSCDIADGVSFDRDRNGVPDECECGADLDHSGDVGFGDLAVLLLEWGPCGDDPCFADLDENGVVEMGDVFQALRGWGDCE